MAANSRERGSRGRGRSNPDDRVESENSLSSGRLSSQNRIRNLRSQECRSRNRDDDRTSSGHAAGSDSSLVSIGAKAVNPDNDDAEASARGDGEGSGKAGPMTRRWVRRGRSQGAASKTIASAAAESVPTDGNGGGEAPIRRKEGAVAPDRDKDGKAGKKKSLSRARDPRRRSPLSRESCSLHSQRFQMRKETNHEKRDERVYSGSIDRYRRRSPSPRKSSMSNNSHYAAEERRDINRECVRSRSHGSPCRSDSRKESRHSPCLVDRSVASDEGGKTTIGRRRRSRPSLDSASSGSRQGQGESAARSRSPRLEAKGSQDSRTKAADDKRGGSASRSRSKLRMAANSRERGSRGRGRSNPDDRVESENSLSSGRLSSQNRIRNFRSQECRSRNRDDDRTSSGHAAGSDSSLVSIGAKAVNPDNDDAEAGARGDGEGSGKAGPMTGRWVRRGRSQGAASKTIASAAAESVPTDGNGGGEAPIRRKEGAVAPDRDKDGKAGKKKSLSRARDPRRRSPLSRESCSLHSQRFQMRKETNHEKRDERVYSGSIDRYRRRSPSPRKSSMSNNSHYAAEERRDINRECVRSRSHGSPCRSDSRKESRHSPCLVDRSVASDEGGKTTIGRRRRSRPSLDSASSGSRQGQGESAARSRSPRLEAKGSQDSRTKAADDKRGGSASRSRSKLRMAANSRERGSRGRGRSNPDDRVESENSLSSGRLSSQNRIRNFRSQECRSRNRDDDRTSSGHAAGSDSSLVSIGAKAVNPDNDDAEAGARGDGEGSGKAGPMTGRWVRRGRSQGAASKTIASAAAESVPTDGNGGGEAPIRRKEGAVAPDRDKDGKAGKKKSLSRARDPRRRSPLSRESCSLHSQRFQMRKETNHEKRDERVYSGSIDRYRRRSPSPRKSSMSNNSHYAAEERRDINRECVRSRSHGSPCRSDSRKESRHSPCLVDRSVASDEGGKTTIGRRRRSRPSLDSASSGSRQGQGESAARSRSPRLEAKGSQDSRTKAADDKRGGSASRSRSKLRMAANSRERGSRGRGRSNPDDRVESENSLSSGRLSSQNRIRNFRSQECRSRNRDDDRTSSGHAAGSDSSLVSIGAKAVNPDNDDAEAGARGDGEGSGKAGPMTGRWVRRGRSQGAASKTIASAAAESVPTDGNGGGEAPIRRKEGAVAPDRDKDGKAGKKKSLSRARDPRRRSPLSRESCSLHSQRFQMRKETNHEKRDERVYSGSIDRYRRRSPSPRKSSMSNNSHYAAEEGRDINRECVRSRSRGSPCRSDSRKESRHSPCLVDRSVASDEGGKTTIGRRKRSRPSLDSASSGSRQGQGESAARSRSPRLEAKGSQDSRTKAADDKRGGSASRSRSKLRMAANSRERGSRGRGRSNPDDRVESENSLSSRRLSSQNRIRNLRSQECRSRNRDDDRTSSGHAAGSDSSLVSIGAKAVNPDNDDAEAGTRGDGEGSGVEPLREREISPSRLPTASPRAAEDPRRAGEAANETETFPGVGEKDGAYSSDSDDSVTFVPALRSVKAKYGDDFYKVFRVEAMERLEEEKEVIRVEEGQRLGTMPPSESPSKKARDITGVMIPRATRKLPRDVHRKILDMFQVVILEPLYYPPPSEVRR